MPRAAETAKLDRERRNPTALIASQTTLRREERRGLIQQ
jgi:hypothetical protein